MTQRFGAIGVFGRANAGKSTLVNALVGEPVSIVSNRPQTTRRRILGILTVGESQVVFCDTPGLHAIRNQLDSFMATEIEATTAGLQGALYLVDTADPVVEEDAAHLAHLGPRLQSGPVFLVLNKIDRAEAGTLDDLEQRYLGLFPFQKVFRISAREGEGLPALQESLLAILPEGPHAYAPDDYTSLTEREIVEEVIREVLLHRYSHEVPHAVAVVVEEFKERENGKTFIAAQLYLEKENHKKIVIGKNGEGIKTVGAMAREKLNQLLGRDIFLQLWVKVRPNWRKSKEWVRRLGYQRR
ncbi:MAG: GTP-binding protein Era [Candidatus Ozemobacter sibiricus]|jgi:GTP-binding protein Era|uniref:GTPase Era n=1 Tax=Candidatus Ozemobacter sibiricus TaxID=2268124 RepID=A0A367ZQR8_9BACT|nr:MAG: GTP-binding protein Era [Candidatus Ozemobacter sibiricus]